MNISRRTFMATAMAAAAMAAGCQLEQLPGTTDAPKLQLPPPDEDGSALWLRYARVYDGRPVGIDSVVVEGESPTLALVREELHKGLTGMSGKDVPLANDVQARALVAGTPAGSEAIRRVNPDLSGVGKEGFIIRPATIGGRQVTLLAANTDIGVLYGAFHILRQCAMGVPASGMTVVEYPRLQLRMMNHWDNLDGSIERGYAGRSLWRWAELPGTLNPRYAAYARANASLGVNGTVLNNVNANPRSLATEYLQKAAALANVFRPWGVKVYLSVNFSAPVTIGRLETADPLSPVVMEWWKKKTEEIYALIPDFGGFLVKANSEGQPGPRDYNRTHAQGANMLADALAPHGGTVIWRAFIYDESVDADRAKRAYLEFTALDGQFRPNVMIQIKNGAIDFMPREPFHPLFGGLKSTQAMAEIQATQEYLGQAKHLVYLGPMWEEFLQSDTHATGPGSTVAKVLEGKVHPQTVTGMATVLNTGADANWCGHIFSQANWYAAGRMSWNPELRAGPIAREWLRQTFTTDQATLQTMYDLMMGSHETFVRYTMPLGLHHLIGGDHYAPQPWNDRAPRADWTAVYYHQAATNGIGFNRTRSGNRAVDQYFKPVSDSFNDPAACPEKFLLWFHRMPWDHKMKSGRTLWEEMCLTYAQGAAEAAAMAATWKSLDGKIDTARHQSVSERLAIQVRDSAQWRDQILQYFQRFSGKEIVKPSGS